MAFTDYKGPLVTFGRARPALSPSGAGALDYNENDPGPGLFSAYGWAMMDTRQQFAYQPDQSGPFYCSLTDGPVVDQAPSAISTTNLASGASIVGGTPVVLVTSNGAGITVGVNVVDQGTGVSYSTWAIDGATGTVPFGTANNLAFGGARWAQAWDPTTMIARGVSLSSTSNLSAINFTILGFDVYGFPMSQTLAGPNDDTVTTTKAFKYVLSVTPSASNGGTLNVGTSDLYGFPLYVPGWAYCSIFWNNILATQVTGTGVAFVAGVTSAASASTGDVRGTYNIGTGTPSNGTIKLQMFWKPSVAGLAAGANGTVGTTGGVYGVPQGIAF